MSDRKTAAGKLKRLIPFMLYLCLWVILFFLMKQRKVERYFNPSLVIDAQIPYIRYFIVPYLLWFPWLAFVWIGTAWTDGRRCRMITLISMTGRTVYLLVSLLWPTAVSLRPPELPDSDVFYRLTAFVYSLADETYVIPSIHVFDSCVALYAVLNGKALSRSKGMRIFAVVITVLICLSTVLTRQHSVVDAAAGILLFFVCLPIGRAAGIITEGENMP